MLLYSPAKLNLFLRVINKRPDGYHELASLFQAISLFDTLSVELAKTDSLQCSTPSIPTDEKNLIWKAVKLFREKTGVKANFKIFLQKRIPHEAGLGGGSGNAATALWALNQLTGKQFTDNHLAEWGAEIGSDVAFFFSKGTAYCTGRGDAIRELPPLERKTVWIAKPPHSLATPVVYKAYKPQEAEQRDPEACLDSFFRGQPEYFNDLEKPAFTIVPPLADFKKELQACCSGPVLMSGSGTSFFCFEKKPPKVKGLIFFKASYVNRKPCSWYELF